MTQDSSDIVSRYEAGIRGIREIFSTLPDDDPIGNPKFDPFPVNIHPIATKISRRLTPAGSADPFEISLDPHYWSPVQLRGMLRRYNDKAIIHYSTEQNSCWRRYTICKELSHLLIDYEPEHYTEDIAVLIQRLLSGIPFAEEGINADAATSEWLAMAMATELLLPWKYRSRLFSMLEDGKSFRDIAEYTRCPLKHVTITLTSPYRELSERINNSITL